MTRPDSTWGGAACPTPITEYDTVQLAHGGGGKLSNALTERVFAPAFDNPALRALHDGALLGVRAGALAMSTDSFVVRPLFFPGGDIGSLAVHGTVNDLAMCGARPVALSVAMILEEGLAMSDLWRVVQSMATAAAHVGVPIVTGDTKVVELGRADGLYVTTTGLGEVLPSARIDAARVVPGDAVLVSGTLGDHGIAVLGARQELGIATDVISDSAPLHALVADLVAALGDDLHFLRDPTRGGLSSATNELARTARVGVRLDERAIPVREEVRGACELLGFDPLYVANEGKLMAVVAGHRAEAARALLRAHPLGRDAAIVGQITDERPGRVVLRSLIGAERVVDMLSGEQLPRIC